MEAEITGRLEHPGIVPVYGLGSYGDGRPYYAMRFIRGESLKEAIAQFHGDERLKHDLGRRSLELCKLLRRFMDICNAIEYAHSRGVLHRDIKPANVIVGKHGETLVVDWGLAKAIGRSDQDVGERTLVPSSAGCGSETLPGSTMGTPAYMSPEQAAGDLENLGPRSDVYSLGATLYCLLIGTPPFVGQVAEVLRAVEKGTFVSPRQLDPMIDPALEAVCLKAMSLRPEDRYGSCRALAEDLERWMADEPNSAWCEPFTRRARRGATESHGGDHGDDRTPDGNRRAGGDPGGASKGQRRTSGRQLPSHDCQPARGASQRRSASRQHGSPPARPGSPTQLPQGTPGGGRFVHPDQRECAPKSPLPGLQPLRKELLESALHYYQGFLREADDDPSVRSELAAAYFRAGSIHAEIGSFDEALNELNAARDLYKNLLTGNPSDRGLREALAGTYQAAGLALISQERYSESIHTLRAAIAVQDTLALETPDDTRLLAAMALSHNKLGVALLETDRREECDRHFAESARLRERLVSLEPGNARFRVDLGIIRQNLAISREWRGELAGNEDAFHQARADLERVVADHPQNASFRSDLSLICRNQGHLLASRARPSEALEALARGVFVTRALVRENPAVARVPRPLLLVLPRACEVADRVRASGRGD